MQHCEHGIEGARRHLVGLRQDLAAALLTRMSSGRWPRSCPSWLRRRRARAVAADRLDVSPGLLCKLLGVCFRTSWAAADHHVWRQLEVAMAPSSGRAPLPPPGHQDALALEQVGLNISRFNILISSAQCRPNQLADLGRRIAVLASTALVSAPNVLGLLRALGPRARELYGIADIAVSHSSPTPCCGAWCADAPSRRIPSPAPDGTPFFISSLANASPSRSLVSARSSASSLACAQPILVGLEAWVVGELGLAQHLHELADCASLRRRSQAPRNSHGNSRPTPTSRQGPQHRWSARQ